MPKTFGGVALTMAKGARIAGIVMSSIGLVIDVGFLVKESIHLHDGAKAESAEKLRQQAQELESTLEFVTEIHENLARGLDSERAWKLCILSPYPALDVSSFWLFPSYILYNKSAIWSLLPLFVRRKSLSQTYGY